ncbi:protein of unknown function [Paraburkholderia kururiensis]
MAVLQISAEPPCVNMSVRIAIAVMRRVAIPLDELPGACALDLGGLGHKGSPETDEAFLLRAVFRFGCFRNGDGYDRQIFPLHHI